MINVKIRIPFDAFARQQMLAEMHVRNGTSTNAKPAGLLLSRSIMPEPEISARAYANEEAGGICSAVVAAGR